MSGISKGERVQLWLDRLKRQSLSSETVAEFCQREEIPVPSFYQWKRRLSPRVESASQHKHRAKTLLPAEPGNKRGFTELVVHAAQVPAHASLPGGLTISLGTHPEIAALIVDRLLKHAANLVSTETARC